MRATRSAIVPHLFLSDMITCVFVWSGLEYITDLVLDRS